MKENITQKQLHKLAKIGDQLRFAGPNGTIIYTITDIITIKSKAHKTKSLQFELNGHLKVSAERIDTMERV